MIVDNMKMLEFSGKKMARVVSQETRDKISAKMKNRVISTEHRQKISDAMKGRSLSLQHKANLSLAMKDVRKEKPEITQMHKEAQLLLWKSKIGEKLKKAIAQKFKEQPIPLKKKLYEQIKNKGFLEMDKQVDIGFWKSFWSDNPELVELYTKASNEAYSKLKKHIKK